MGLENLGYIVDGGLAPRPRGLPPTSHKLGRPLGLAFAQ
jgi:hypothetical protein